MSMQAWEEGHFACQTSLAPFSTRWQPLLLAGVLAGARWQDRRATPEGYKHCSDRVDVCAHMLMRVFVTLEHCSFAGKANT